MFPMLYVVWFFGAAPTPVAVFTSAETCLSVAEDQQKILGGGTIRYRCIPTNFVPWTTK